MNGLFLLAALVGGAALAYTLTREKPKPLSFTEQLGGIGDAFNSFGETFESWFGDDDDAELDKSGNPIGAQSNRPATEAAARYVDMSSEPTVQTLVSARVFSPQPPLDLYDV
jgi:hypothetical protein